MTEPLDIETSARRTGTHRWIERRLFEILGRWSAGLGQPAVQALVGAHSRHHAWRAELWGTCLPTLPHLDPELVTGPSSPALAAFLDDVADAADALDPVAKLAGVYRVVVPRLEVAYTRRREGQAEVTDAPVLRVLRLVRADLRRDAAAGELLVQSLLKSSEAARRVAERQGWLEGQLIEAGGIP